MVNNQTCNTDHRPWGYFVVLSDREDHKIKRIVVCPGKRLSLQRHQKRSEHWFFLNGNALVTLGQRQLEVSADQSLNIAQNTIHRVENIGQQDVVFIEIQTGDYFGEDDIERFEDDFGRI